MTEQNKGETKFTQPFDLERAKAGDNVEILDFTGWKNCNSKTFEMLKHPLVKLDNTSVSVFNLRMKYPPKVNHE